jgi:hypothetical protein
MLGLLVILLLALAGGGYWRWLQQQQSSSAPLTVCLPSNTVVFAHVPDGTASYQRFLQSNLYKIASSKEVSGLLAQASNTPGLSGASGFSAKEAWAWLGQLTACLDGESFVAMGNPDFNQLVRNRIKDFPLLLGLRSKSGQKNIQALIEKCKKGLQEQGVTPQTGEGTHAGVRYEWIETPFGCRIYHAYTQGWALTCLSEPMLKGFIDRIQKPDPATSLRESPSFKLVLEHLDKNPDAYFYVDYKSMLENIASQIDRMTVESRGKNAKSTADHVKVKMQRLNQLVGPFGMSVRFDGLHITDRIFFSMPGVARPDLGKTLTPCAFKTLSFSSADTRLYFSQNLDARKQFDYTINLYKEEVPELAKWIGQVKSMLTAQGVDLDKNILDALGPEIACCVDWPSASLWPEPALFWELASAENFRPTVDWVIRYLEEQETGSGDQKAPLGKFEDLQIGGHATKVFRFTRPLPISPVIVSNEKYLALFMTQQGANYFLAGEGKTPITSSAAFKAVCPAVTDSSSFLLYCDMQNLIDRSYQIAKPYALLAASFVPELQKVMSSTTLPEKLSFTSHLGSWVMTSKVTDAGIVTESKSSIGMPLLPLTGVGIAAAVLVPQLTQKGKASSYRTDAEPEPPQSPSSSNAESQAAPPTEQDSAAHSAAEREAQIVNSIEPAPAGEEPAPAPPQEPPVEPPPAD